MKFFFHQTEVAIELGTSSFRFWYSTSVGCN